MSVSLAVANKREKMKTEAIALHGVFVVFECLKSLKKHVKRVFELASETCIISDLSLACFVDLYIGIMRHVI